MPFSPQALLDELYRLPQAQRYLVAYSGGADSHVLLHALAALTPQLGTPILALHVDHGLQPDSARWAEHCQQVCADLGIESRVLPVLVDSSGGEGLEAAARQARYQALAAQMQAGDALLTAHHQDDQAETLLLQLLRGAGPRGLAAMAAEGELACGLMLRPLLGFGREELMAYAHSVGIVWVEDPSNIDERFDRNYLRHQVMPRLRQRWPAMAQTLGRAARHQAEASRLLAELGTADLQGYAEGDALQLAALQGLSLARQKNLLRQWIEACGYPVPDERRLHTIFAQLIPAREDAMPQVAWAGVELRRYRERLYLMPALAEPVMELRLSWDGSPLSLPPAGMQLQLIDSEEGLRRSLFDEGRVEVGFRRGGERCRPHGHKQSKSLKKLLQEAGVPPWLRERLPLIYVDGELAAVPGVCLDEAYAAQKGEAAVMPVWNWPKCAPPGQISIENKREKSDN